MFRHLVLGALLAGSVFACAAQPDDGEEAAQGGEDALTQKADDAWFYGGPLKKLSNASITVSLKANTAHVTGYLPEGTVLPTLPHVRTKAENGKLRVDVVYPIASAETSAGKSNSRPGTYEFYSATPYRPDGMAYTVSAGAHFVTWGGFPFLGYNNGIAFHGPITSELSSTGDQKTWYLRRGRVSSGCNRMQGENVVELAELIGIDMQHVWGANQQVPSPSSAKVIVTNEYDTLDGQLIDVDYATDVGITRPTGNVAMFGSWVASATPDGKDLPPDMKWEGGVNGKPYVFAEHIIPGMVCNVPKAQLPGLKTLQTKLGGSLGASFCAKKDCVLDAIKAGTDAKAVCSL